MRPTWAEIDIESLKSNFLTVKSIVGKDVGIVSVVKADAYGHGAVPISKALVESGADMLGVATVEEALQLREHGIRNPIILFGGIGHEEAEIAVKKDLIPSLFSISSAEALSKSAASMGMRAKYHLEVDSGMSRLGIRLVEMQDFLSRLLRFDNLIMEGAFTHFADADGKLEHSVSDQIEVFIDSLSVICRAGIYPKYIHSANSAAIQRFPKSHMDLVRPGIMLYGSGEIGNYELSPVMRLKTRVVQIKSVPANTKIGYGGSFITKRPSVIATLPIGYADGYMRSLSNRAKVSIGGAAAPVVGAVCMDFIMIDVTDVPGVSVGDQVTLFGDGVVSVEDVARWAGTIAYEVLSMVSRRVPRVYI